MQIYPLSKKQVFEMPLSDIRDHNREWRKMISEHYQPYLLAALKGEYTTMDEFILADKDLKDLHLQFRWESLDAHDRLKEKFPERFKSHKDFKSYIIVDDENSSYHSEQDSF